MSLLLAWAARRVVVLLLVFITSFVLVSAVPGTLGTAAQAEDAAQREDRARIRAELHLDRPLIERLALTSRDLVTGRLRSWALPGRPGVIGLVIDALGGSLLLYFLATMMGWSVAFPAALEAARRPGGAVDRVVGAGTLVLSSTPSFLVAYAVVVGARVAGLPFGGPHRAWLVNGHGPATSHADLLWSSLLPAAAIAAGTWAVVGRVLRVRASQVLLEPFIEHARLRGVDEERILFVHVLRNSLLPVVTLFGLYLPWIVGGTLVVETVFSWPGLGRLAYDAFLDRDVPVALGVTVAVSIVVLLGTSFSELLYQAVDPRTRSTELPRVNHA